MTKGKGWVAFPVNGELNRARAAARCFTRGPSVDFSDPDANTSSSPYDRDTEENSRHCNRGPGIHGPLVLLNPVESDAVENNAP